MTITNKKELTRAIIGNKQVWYAVLLLFIAGNVFVTVFVRQEKYLYFFDFVGYWSRYVFLNEYFLNDPMFTLQALVQSIRAEKYNHLPAFLLMPFGFLFGTSRLAYILSIVNIFAVPVAVTFVVLNRKFAQAYGPAMATMPVLAVLAALVLPNFWHPVLMGLPDVGGIILTNVIPWMYFCSPFTGQKWRDLMVIAVLVALLVLFRRWYAFWGVAFYLALFLVESGTALLERRGGIRVHLNIVSRLGLSQPVRLRKTLFSIFINRPLIWGRSD